MTTKLENLDVVNGISLSGESVQVSERYRFTPNKLEAVRIAPKKPSRPTLIGVPKPAVYAKRKS